MPYGWHFPKDSTEHKVHGDDVHGYLVRDTDCPNPIEEFDEGELVLWTTQTELDETMERIKASGKPYFLLNKYEHGNVHYSLADTRAYPDERWDVTRNCSVYVPPEDATNPEEYARAAIDEYTKWVNGDCWGYVIENKDGSVDDCYGFIGFGHAKESFEEAWKSAIAAPSTES